MQKQNTFTQVDNSLLETLYSSKLTASELRVMLFIIRQTAGYHRQSHELSAGFIAKGTWLYIRTVERTVAKLRKKNLIQTSCAQGLPNTVILLHTTVSEDGRTTVTNDGGVPSRRTEELPSRVTDKEIKKIKSKESVSPTLDYVIEYCQEMSRTIDAERFFDYYEAVGWQRNGQPITNWKAVARNWQARERTQPVVEYVEKDDWGRPIPPEVCLINSVCENIKDHFQIFLCGKVE